MTEQRVGVKSQFSERRETVFRPSEADLCAAEIEYIFAIARAQRTKEESYHHYRQNENDSLFEPDKRVSIESSIFEGPETETMFFWRVLESGGVQRYRRRLFEMGAGQPRTKQKDFVRKATLAGPYVLGRELVRVVNNKTTGRKEVSFWRPPWHRIKLPEKGDATVLDRAIRKASADLIEATISVPPKNQFVLEKAEDLPGWQMEETCGDSQHGLWLLQADCFLSYKPEKSDPWERMIFEFAMMLATSEVSTGDLLPDFELRRKTYWLVGNSLTDLKRRLGRCKRVERSPSGITKHLREKNPRGFGEIVGDEIMTVNFPVIDGGKIHSFLSVCAVGHGGKTRSYTFSLFSVQPPVNRRIRKRKQSEIIDRAFKKGLPEELISVEFDSNTKGFPYFVGHRFPEGYPTDEALEGYQAIIDSSSAGQLKSAKRLKELLQAAGIVKPDSEVK